MTVQSKPTPWYLWPFVALWDLITAIVKLTGRLIAILLGTVLMIAGAILTALVVTAPIGIPLVVLGLLLVVKGFF